MWKRICLVLVLGCLAFSCMGSKGCSINEAETGLTNVKEKTDLVTPYVPTSHTYIPATISAVCTAALAFIRIIKERRETRRMKTAIKVKSKQIDKIIAAPSNPDPSKINPVLAFMRADKTTARGKKLDALDTFDDVRNGYI